MKKVRLHLLKKENYGKNINTTEIHKTKRSMKKQGMKQIV
jgi:hypothetical protein